MDTKRTSDKDKALNSNADSSTDDRMGPRAADEMRFERLLRLAASLQAGQSDSVSASAESQAAPAATGKAGARREVEARAYEIFLERGATHGSDMDDWLRAESELQTKPTIERNPERDKAVMRLALAWGVPNIASDNLGTSS